MVRMKRVVSAFMVILLVLSLAGCGGNKASGEEDGKYTLTVWYWGEQEAPGYKAYMEEMVRRYEKENPDITVEAILQESDNLYSAFRTAEAAGEGPDIQYMWGGTQAMEDVWKGNVTPISDYLSKEELSVIEQASLMETNWDDKQITDHLGIEPQLFQCAFDGAGGFPGPGKVVPRDLVMIM